MITVGVPAHNEEKSIEKCAKAILEQISKKDELIIVSDGSSDNTVSIIKKLSKKDKRVRLIEVKERKGKVNGLNLIIKKARSDIIVQTDGDVIISPNSIKYLLGHFKDEKVGGVSGNPVPVIPKDNLFYDWTIMSYRKAGELRQKQSKEGTLWHMSGYLLAFRKKAIKEIPPAKGAVDAWMGKIIRESGYKISYEPKAKVFVKTPLNTKDFIKQKSRVRAGFDLLPKGPRKVSQEIFYFPSELMKVPIERWPSFIFSGFIYFYTWINGIYMSRTNKSHNQIWKIPTSTK